jgi:hypothetical protein
MKMASTGRAMETLFWLRANRVRRSGSHVSARDLNRLGFQGFVFSPGALLLLAVSVTMSRNLQLPSIEIGTYSEVRL